MIKRRPSAKETSYTHKVWQTVAIVALLAVVILIARVAFNVLLMVLAGALIATFFHGFGDLIQRHTRLGRRPAMIIAVAGSFALLGLMLWFMGTTIQHQVAELSDKLPQTISNVKAKMSTSPIGQKILQSVSGDNSQKLMTTAQTFFSTSFGVLGDIYIIMFLGIFFTANPSMYKNGILVLVPSGQKDTGKHIINRISLALKGWLKGLMVSMVLVTIMISTGLLIIGVPVAMVLGLITGLLEVVPNFGSVLAMIPGVLLALTISTNTGIIVALLYITSQTITANIVNPLIQKKMINLPPALTLISQLIMGAISGALGIILAVPLLAITVILVDELYVKTIDGGKVTDEGELEAKT
ncbi:AI-2E family transporter [Mucilaginibacter mali]|uniref:AI-2E family transporter n=1 Tax=Mucilaginibacter mali TaxID=2740462 RepID=A0A7D4Q5I2_9SPHI|nr:AI-2E family transporter [Mucilaginibacter mali]QKJ28571.1 AI-2E family transporter [Mucilaginibacter mali]